ncbi:tetraspanin-13 isoform X2 [Chironomus tepperi]|uniref:tetraspanin-13 isoform X2 n=1 Tax=Chironomus tepperi TaxID=113505 RepID=UPI00391F605A
MCGGFYCSRNSLICLNLMYIVVGSLLIASGIYGNRYTDLPILPSIVGCGIVLIGLSILGLYGAAKHHQVSLFFYMIILFCLFIVQFAIACSCLAVDQKKQISFAEEGWNNIPDNLKEEVQTTFTCCGFNSSVINDHPSCDAINKICCQSKPADDCACSPCLPKLKDLIDSAFRVSGSIGLFFSFTELLGVILTVRYRNQKNLHNSAFL